jgi:multiple sugar transport system substrate-binding protein
VQESYATLSLPVWKASYTTEAVMKGQEDLVAAANQSIAAMSPRPLIASYTEVSGILQSAIHGALLGETTADAALTEAADRIARIR